MTARSKPMFWKQFIQNYAAVGALLPSSSALGQAGAAYLAHPRSQPIRVLEAGAGTGSFTCEAIPLLRAGDRIDVVEINPSLIGYLRARLARAKLPADPAVDVRLICADLLDFPLAAEYDIILCSLPFSNFPFPLVDGLLAQIIGHLKPGGVFSYVKYAGLGAIKRWGSNAIGREEIDRKQALFDAYARTHQLERRLVVRNVPPTWVYYWRTPLQPVAPAATEQEDSHVIHA